jgi:hypothetical protein
MKPKHPKSVEIRNNLAFVKNSDENWSKTNLTRKCEYKMDL